MLTLQLFLFFLAHHAIFPYLESASAFLIVTTTRARKSQTAPSTTRSPSSHPFLTNHPVPNAFVLNAGFEQLPGESNTDFIKRITSQSDDFMDQQKAKAKKMTMPSRRGKSSSNESITEEGESDKPKGKYQRIEEWDAEKKANGELAWEQKVQFDGQRFGNQVKQDSILRRHLGTF